ncbi:MAG TPA: CPBP family glutamic-type intramembrane protease, partial [Actinomycetota bacterium]
METAVIVAGLAAEAVVWWLVATRRADVWRLMPPVLSAMGVAAVAVRPPVAAGATDATIALAAGLAAGVALYLATRAFVWVASRWGPFRRDVLETYGQAGDVTLATTLVLSLAIMVPAEELFWRGLVQAHLQGATAAATAALATWAAYIGVNLASRSQPIVAAAIVGGAAWAGLAWWSEG